MLYDKIRYQLMTRKKSWPRHIKASGLTFTQTFPVYAYTQERPGIHPGNPDLNIVDSYAHYNSIRTGFFLIS